MSVDVITTVSRREQKLTKAPGTIHIITRDKIKSRGYKDIKDIFRDLPGFDISENVTGEVRTLAINRGILGANKFLFLLDGQRLNPSTGERFVLGNNIPLQMVKQIEVVYGPTAAMYGADAYAGTANIVTLSADELRESGYGNELDISVGSNATHDYSFIGSTQFKKNRSLIFHVRRYSSNGFDLAKQSDSYSENALGYDYVQPVKDWSFYSKYKAGKFKISLSHQNAKEPGGAAGASRALNYQMSSDFVWHQKQTIININHNSKVGAYKLRSSLSYEWYELGSGTNFRYKDHKEYQMAHNHSITLDEVFERKLDDKTIMIAGFNFQHADAFPKFGGQLTPYSGNERTHTLAYPLSSAAVPVPAAISGKVLNMDVQRYSQYGIFSEWTRQVSDRLQLNIGLRYDYNTDYSSVVTPRVGLVYSPCKYTNLKLLYGSAYIKPSKYLTHEHWVAYINGIASYGFYPNEALQPEEMDTWQFNIEKQLTRKSKLTLNTFSNRLSNLIRPERQNGTSWSQNVNSGSQIARGFELMFDYEPTDKISTYLYYSHLDTKWIGQPLTKAAQNKLHAGITRYKNRHSISMRVRYSGEKPRFSTTAGVLEKIDAHTVLDFSWRTKVSDAREIYLTVNNLLDTQYEAATPFGEVRDWLEKTAIQPARYIELGFTQRF
jgi:iron complex outermembrane receptor protein